MNKPPGAYHKLEWGGEIALLTPLWLHVGAPCLCWTVFFGGGGCSFSFFPICNIKKQWEVERQREKTRRGEAEDQEREAYSHTRGRLKTILPLKVNCLMGQSDS